MWILLFRNGVEDSCRKPTPRRLAKGVDSGKNRKGKRARTKRKVSKEDVRINESDYFRHVTVDYLLNDMLNFVEVYPDMTKESDYCCGNVIHSTLIVES